RAAVHRRVFLCFSNLSALNANEVAPVCGGSRQPTWRASPMLDSCPADGLADQPADRASRCRENFSLELHGRIVNLSIFRIQCLAAPKIRADLFHAEEGAVADMRRGRCTRFNPDNPPTDSITARREPDSCLTALMQPNAKDVVGSGLGRKDDAQRKWNE